MTLPRTGQIGLGDINVELGRSRTAQISLDTAENGGYGTINVESRLRPNATNPAAISEWYGYNHTFTPAPTTVPLVWNYFNQSASTLPFQIFVNGLLTVSTTNNGAAFLEVPINASVRFVVRENTRRPDWQYVIVRNSQNDPIVAEVIDDFAVDVTIIADAGETYDVDAGNTNTPPFI
jgi:hypothetical protein